MPQGEHNGALALGRWGPRQSSRSAPLQAGLAPNVVRAVKAVRAAPRIDYAVKARVGGRIVKRGNGGKHRVTIRSRTGQWHYDLAGRPHGGVRTPHKVWHPRNPRAPHGWGKPQKRAHPMSWRDMYRVYRY